MTHGIPTPEAWARVEEIYPNSTVVNAVTLQPPNNLIQGGVGMAVVHCEGHEQLRVWVGLVGAPAAVPLWALKVNYCP